MTNDHIEILLVEDNPKDLELTLHALKKNNLANNIFIARDGQEALDFFFGKDASKRNAQPKLVLLDLKLPKVMGLDVLRAMKGDERTKSIPVVVLTSSTQEQDLVESYNLGVNSYLRKPVDFGEFLNTVKTIGLFWLLMNKVPGEPR